MKIPFNSGIFFFMPFRKFKILSKIFGYTRKFTLQTSLLISYDKNFNAESTEERNNENTMRRLKI